MSSTYPASELLLRRQGLLNGKAGVHVSILDQRFGARIRERAAEKLERQIVLLAPIGRAASVEQRIGGM